MRLPLPADDSEKHSHVDRPLHVPEEVAVALGQDPVSISKRDGRDALLYKAIRRFGKECWRQGDNTAEVVARASTYNTSFQRWFSDPLEYEVVGRVFRAAGGDRG
jgi:hypothetical protein